MKEAVAPASASLSSDTEGGRGSTPSRFVSLRGGSRPAAETRLLRSLSWLIAIRLVVITSVVLPYLLVQLASPTGLPTFDLLFLIAGLTYVASLVYITLLRLLRRRPVAQAYIQFVGDLLLVTGLVYFFGGIGSSFSLFYLVVIMVATVMLGRRGGLIVATAAYILYGGLMTALARHQVPAVRPTLSEEEISWRLPYNLAVHLFGFYAVAFLTSYLVENVRRAEQELEEKRDSLANLEVLHHDIVQSISTGLATVGPSGHLASINRAGCEILGRKPEELLGQPVELLGLAGKEAWQSLAQQVTGDGHAPRHETEIARGDRKLPIGFSITPLSDAAGEIVGTIVVFQDLSQWRRLEEELRLKDRMAAVGELAAGIAHEVGNPLAAISGSVQLLSQALATNDAQRKLLDIILRESQRLDRTIKGFLRFARPRDRSIGGFDIAALLAESTALLRNSPETSPDHRIALELDPPTASLVGDRDQISQIFWNLAQNALRAMPDGGTLTIRGTLAGGRYRMEFADTGFGMSEDQRKRLFQPFRSAFDQGTGIGMAIVYRIVHEHSGRVEVDSAVGAGTLIRIELPTNAAVVAIGA